MDNQANRKNHTAGHDSHGVHVCHKCGWPFPNPHPSARHRRAHKKICGTIEGYKLIDSKGSAHSDDEHLSDEDHKTPSPQILNRSNIEKDSAGVGERSNKSEDEVFVDAVAEFPDSGSCRGMEESSDDAKKPAKFIETILDNDTKIALSFEDDAVSDAISPSSNADDSSHIQNTAVQGNYLSGNALDCKSQGSSDTIGSMERSLTECNTGESGFESIDEKQSSTSNSNPILLETQTDVNPIQLEIQTDESREDMGKTAEGNNAETQETGNEAQNKKNNANDDFVEVDTKANKKTHLYEHPLDVEVSSDNVTEVSEAVSRLVKIDDIASNAAPAAGVIQLKQQCDDDSCSNALSPAVEYVEHMKVVAGEEMASASSGKLTETDKEKDESNDNFHVISVGDIPVVENAEVMIGGNKDHNVGSMTQLVGTDQFEVINNIKESDFNDNRFNFISSLSDEGIQISASDMHASKDDLGQEGGNSGHAVEKCLKETELDVPQVKVVVNEGRTDDFCAPQDAAANEVEKSCTVQYPQEQLPHDYDNNSSESISLGHAMDPVSDMTLVVAPVDTKVRQISNLVGLDDAGDHEKGGTKTVDTADNVEVKRITYNPVSDMTPVAAPVDTEVRQISYLVGLDDAGDHEKGGTKIDDTSDNAEVKRITEDPVSDLTSVAAPVDTEVSQISNLVGLDVAGDHEKGGTKTDDTADNEEVKRITEDSFTGNIMATHENPCILSEVKVDGRTDTFAGDNEKDKAESYYQPEIGTEEVDSSVGLVDGSHPLKTTMMPESAKDLQETCITSKDVINASTTDVSEHECEHLSTDSDNQVILMESETIDKEKVHVKDVDGASAASESDNVGDNDELRKSSNNAGDVEVLQKPSDNIDDSWVLQTSTEENMKIEPQHALDASSSLPNSATNGDNLARDFVGAVSENQSKSLPNEGENKVVTQELGACTNNAGDVEVLQKPSDNIDDSGVLQKSAEEHMTIEPQHAPDASSSLPNSASNGDNLARNFVGAISEKQSKCLPDEGENKVVTQELGASTADFLFDSVFSTQSDMQAIVDTEHLASNGSKASAGAEKADMKKSKALTEAAPQSDKSDMFEPPSFMTLVEPRGGEKAATSEIGKADNSQQPKAVQACWFPSLTNVVNESQGRKKNEEIIAKVTNWSAGKQHTQLKNLLGEANVENNSKLTNAKENHPPVVDESDAKDNGASTPIAGAEMPMPQPFKKEVGKEWNSPARYPADIKREKRKVKGRPYWAQFMCCSSVN